MYAAPLLLLMISGGIQLARADNSSNPILNGIQSANVTTNVSAAINTTIADHTRGMYYLVTTL